MSRMVRAFIEVGGEVPLADLASQLGEVLAGLPEGAKDAVVRARGDAIVGHTIQVTYLRPQTAAEAQLDARYAAEGQPLGNAKRC